MTSFDPDHHLDTSLLLCIYQPLPQDDQEPTSSSTSRPYIQLHCNADTNIIHMRDGNPVYATDRKSKIKSRVYVSSETLDRDLVTVLSNWEVPDTYHEQIVYNVLKTVDELDTSLPTQTPCLLVVDLTAESYYSPTPEALMEWESEFLRGNVPESDYDGMVPTSESAIKSLVVRKRKRKREDVDEEEGGSNCPICLEGFTVVSETGSLPCSHMFHQDCITNWLRRSHYCPLCRFKMPTTRGGP